MHGQPEIMRTAGADETILAFSENGIAGSVQALINLKFCYVFIISIMTSAS